MKLYMEQLIPESWTMNPRKIRRDFLAGKITKPERNLLYYMRSGGDMYGILTVNLEGLAADTFNNYVTKNYINKLLLSLKSKRYIWYDDRSGRRGSFDVHFGYWLLPDKHIKSLEIYFNSREVRGENAAEGAGHSEEGPGVGSVSQSFEVQDTLVKPKATAKSIGDLLRGCNNDKEKETKNEIGSIGSNSLKNEDYSFDRFKVQSYEEERCMVIAKTVGDGDVAFCVGTYRKHGLNVLEGAFGEFQSAGGATKDNPAAFFNSLVQKRIPIDLGH